MPSLGIINLPDRLTALGFIQLSRFSSSSGYTWEFLKNPWDIRHLAMPMEKGTQVASLLQIYLAFL